MTDDALALPKGAKPAKLPETVDLTPTWRGVLPLLVMALTNGSDSAKVNAERELARMAEAADRWNASNRGKGA